VANRTGHRATDTTQLLGGANSVGLFGGFLVAGAVAMAHHEAIESRIFRSGDAT